MDDQDAELLRTLQEEHGDALLAHAVRLTGGDRQRAEDLVWQTLLSAWRHPEVLDPERGALRSWLFTTAGRLADGREPAGARAFADEAETARVVEAWAVAEAVGRLSAAHREVLVECFYQGRSVAETASRLGVPAGTVTSRAHYAVRQLRLVLQEMGVTR